MEKEFLLGKWHVNPAERLITCGDQEKYLEPKASALLMQLVEAEGQVVSRNEILDRVWANQVVGDDVINSCIASLRKALGDDRKTNKYIQTVPKKGYKLVKSVVWNTLSPKSISGLAETADSEYSPSQRVNSNEIWAGQDRRANNNPIRLVASILTALVAVFIISLLYPSIKQPDLVQVDNSIAVLPFDVYSKNTDMSFFADGLAEEMLHQLAANPVLKVIARSASFQYRNSSKELTTISSELNAKYLIEGSIREFNNELKITVQLIDAKNNYQLWSRVFSDKTEKLFKIQEDVAIAVNNMLSIEEDLTEWKNERRHPPSAEAFKYFVMAQAHFKAANKDSYKNAELLLNKAIEIAPDYALAYSSKAVSHLLQYQYNRTSLKKETAKAVEAIQKALTLDPEHAEAFAARGLMYTYTGEAKKAELAFLHAIELNPRLRIAHHNFAFLLWNQARYQQAIEHLEFALAADPLAKPTNFLMGDALGRIGEFDKAIEHYQLCQKVIPDYVWCHSGLAEIYRITGKLQQAKKHMESSEKLANTGDFWRANSHARLLIYLNQLDDANDMLEQIGQETGATYVLWHNRFLIALAENKMNDFILRVNNQYDVLPSNKTVKKFKALTAYWQEDYQTAKTIYEKLIEDEPNMMFELWDYADGISHPINLAFTYDMLGLHKKKQKLLMRIDQHLNSFPEKLTLVKGAIYVQAQYQYLLGKNDKAQSLLNSINKDWALSWLIHKDKFWSI